MIALIEWSPAWLMVTLVLFMLGLVMNLAFKFIFVHFAPQWAMSRPDVCGGPTVLMQRQRAKGSTRTVPVELCSMCGVLPEYVNKNGIRVKRPKSSFACGMPSGHVQLATLAAVWWTCTMAHRSRALSQWHTVITCGVMWLWAALVAWQRVSSRCHSVAQVIVGGSLGALLGVIMAAVSVGAHTLVAVVRA